MDDEAHQRLQRHIFPRPPNDVIDSAALAGFREPEKQTWIHGDDFHADQPRRFRCGFHGADARNPGPVEIVELVGVDGKTYRAGQCKLCGSIFWGVRGERPAAERR
jgi:hypothetical protein